MYVHCNWIIFTCALLGQAFLANTGAVIHTDIQRITEFKFCIMYKIIFKFSELNVSDPSSYTVTAQRRAMPDWSSDKKALYYTD